MDRHSCESRNPANQIPVILDARFRGHEEKNTPTALLRMVKDQIKTKEVGDG
jgi:hypothetical protein